MQAKLTDLEKRMAYVLNKDINFGYSMSSIGKLMGVSQSTISNAIKQVDYLRQITNLEMELEEAKRQLNILLPTQNIIQPVIPYIIEN